MCMQSGGNREAARLSGVPIKKVEIIVFTLSAPWRRLRVWFWHRECIPDSRPSEVAMRWMRSRCVSAEARWQADADVSAVQYSARW